MADPYRTPAPVPDLYARGEKARALWTKNTMEKRANRLSGPAWVAKHFPTSHARDAADRAIDDMDPHAPMSAYLDAWIAAYLKAGGKTELRLQ